MGACYKDFDTISQMDLTRVKFHLWCRLLFYPNSNPIILRSSWETSLFKGQHGEHLAINVSWSTVMHELFCNCVLVQDLFSYPYQNRLTLHSERKCLVYQAAVGTLMRGVKGGLAKGFTSNSFAFQKSQNKIIVIVIYLDFHSAK